MKNYLLRLTNCYCESLTHKHTEKQRDFANVKFKPLMRHVCVCIVYTSGKACDQPSPHGLLVIRRT